MDPKIIAACEAFSTGELEPALELMTSAVQWKIVGDHTIMGKSGVERECKEAVEQGAPNFKNEKTHWGKEHVIVEGGDSDGNIYYCDIYTINFEQITKITSYGLSSAE